MQKHSILFLVVALSVTGCGATSSRQSSELLPEGITVYFNNPLAGLPEMNDPPAQSNGLDQALIKIIDSAHMSLDIAIYHLTAPDVIEALHRACSRGVRIRIVLEATESQPQGLPNCIQRKLDLNERLMHHKFMIVDQRAIWTGSTNWTPSGLYFDANNAVLIQSPAVTHAYEAEFEEMFTSAHYDSAKRDTNEERFEVNGIALEVYFSPSDRTRRRLLELIGNARETIRLALYVFTDAQLYDELMSARDRGVRIEALWDFLSLADCQFSKVDELRKAGIGQFEANPGLLHHKYAIIDDRLVITGSANWSGSGMDKNDENILIIQDERITQQFRANFEQLTSDAQAYGSDVSQPPRVEVRHFDIARDASLIQWHPHTLGVIDRYEICRLSNSQSHTCERTYEAPGWAWYFLDENVTSGREYSYRLRSHSGTRWTGYSNIYRAWVADDIPRLTAEAVERDFQQYEGKTVTVRFQVTNRPQPRGPEGNIYLNAGEDYKTDFTAFVPACALERFTGSGLDLFELRGQQIEVTGELGEYNGPEVVVTGPWQIHIAR